MAQSDSNFEFLRPRQVLGCSQTVQISVVAALYTLTTIGYYLEMKATGKISGYSPSVSLLFVPIYEEVIFRGILLRYFEKSYGWIKAMVIVSVLFGLWHLKNIFWKDLSSLSNQMAYTALLFSPITCWITLRTRTIWPAVMIHYLNNFPYKYFHS